MGDSDRLKNYISDYLENSLDPSTHKDFEDALKKSPELRTMTDRVAAISMHLGKLKNHKCSDDFSVKLRERIHTTPGPLISRQNLIRYSFAASFIIIIVIATFTITNLMTESPESTPPIQGSTQSPMENVNPVSSTNIDKTLRDGEELPIKSKSNQNTPSDSLRIQQEEKKNNPSIKYIDQKK